MKKEIQLTESFINVRCKDYGTLVLTQGDQTSLVIEADDDILPGLITEVRGDTLVLGLEEDWFGQIGKVLSSIFNNTDCKVTYYLTAADLDKVTISGKISMKCEAFQTDALTLKVSGLGDLVFNRLDCNSLDVIISGRGEFAAAGRANHQMVRISGSGEYEAPELASQTLRMVISGQGNATVRVEESLDITISGMGQVNYYGRPKLRQVISGLGKSKRLNDQ